MAWLAAAAAALGGAAISASASSSAASKAAGANAVPKPEMKPFTPSANAFATPGKGTGADLSSTFSKSALPELPQGKSATDVYRMADALKETSFSPAGQPPPAAGPMSSLPTGASAATASGGTAATASGKSDWVDKAQLYSQLGSMASNAFAAPPISGGGIPQAGSTAYSPTAAAAQQRLAQLIAARRAGGGF